MFEFVKNEKNRISSLLDEIQGYGEGTRIVLYGAGYCGHEALAQFRLRGIPVYAVCDDGRIGQDLDGFPITDISDIGHSENLIIFVTCGFNGGMIVKLKELGLGDYYRDADFGRYEPEKETYDFFFEHSKEVEKVYRLLKDELSKKLYLNLINYRISRNPKYLSGMIERTPQYYPDEPNLGAIVPEGFDNHVFMDLGAYDGDSVCGFIEYVNGKYDGIIAIEASERNYRLLVEKCRNLRNIDCINIGIADEKKMMRFSMSDAKNSFASSDGECMLAVDSVDNILKDRKVSFIKMDVEGAEYDAIQGAYKTIKRWTPILAISVYHLTEDLFRIALEVEKIAPSTYEYYLRHYSPTMIETVLYAVPKAHRYHCDRQK